MVAAAMLAGSSTGQVAVAADGTLLLANPAAEALLGPLLAGRALARVPGMGPVAQVVRLLARGTDPAGGDPPLAVDLPSGRRVLVEVSRLPGLGPPGGFALVVREDPRFGPAVHDAHTGLLNRRGLLGHMEMLAGHGGGVVASFDIDGLKLVNDRFGHKSGDAVIVHVATGLASAVPHPGVAARVGGDEFVALLPGRRLADAAPVLARITAAASGPVRLLDDRGSVVASVSVGAAELTAGRYPDHALFRADRALHVAKARGGNTIILDGPEVQDWARDRSALMSWLHQLRTENDTLRQQTLTDPLTGLPNLRALRHAEDLLAGADYPVGVISADLDRFSAYNHHHGDTALTTVARALVASLRDGDQVFRKGGEEFVALLPGATDQVTDLVAERLRTAVHALGLPHAGNPPTGLLTLTVAAVTTSPGTKPAQARADAADLVYAAKLADARNRVHHPHHRPPGPAAPTQPQA